MINNFLINFKTANSDYDNYKSFLLYKIIEPSIFYAFWYLLGSSVVGINNVEFIIIGTLVFFPVQSMLLKIVGMFRFERSNKTLELNVGSPVNTSIIILKKIFLFFLDSLILFIFGLAFVYIAFNIDIDLGILISMLFIILLTFISTISLGIIIGGIGLLMRNVNLFINLTISVLSIVGGVYFPLSSLPVQINLLASFVPTVNGLLAFRILQAESTMDYQLIWRELSIGITLFILSIIFIFMMERIAIKKGSLSLE